MVRNSFFYHYDLLNSFLANNKDKVVPLNALQVNGIQKKVQLLLDSSGAKIQPLKRRIVESTTESTRGIWSGLHADRPIL
jgi:large subunit ribosomal protein L43